MRKLVLGTVAAAASVALALPASADDMMDGVSISGYMNHDFGFGSYDRRRQWPWTTTTRRSMPN